MARWVTKVVKFTVEHEESVEKPERLSSWEQRVLGLTEQVKMLCENVLILESVDRPKVTKGGNLPAKRSKCKMTETDATVRQA